MNFSHLVSHINAGKLPRTVALTGVGPSLITMETLVLGDSAYERVYGTPREVAQRLSSVPLTGMERTFVLTDVLPHLTISDIPWIERVLHKRSGIRTVWVGGEPTAELVRTQFSKSTAKTYEAGFGHTATQKKIFVSWVQHMSGLSLPMSKLVADLSLWDETAAAALAHKAALLGEAITPHDLASLAPQSGGQSFAEALLTHRLGEAVSIAKTLSYGHLQHTLTHLASMVRLMGRIYPAVQRISEPGVQASKLTGVPVPTLQRYWSVAGHYAPVDVVRHLMAISEAASTGISEYRGQQALVTLTLSW